MANWSELRVLKAKDNKMIALPDTLGACAKLEKLNLAYNVWPPVHPPTQMVQCARNAAHCHAHE